MTADTSRPEVVLIKNVRKSFVVRKDNTLKDRVLSVLRRRSTHKVYRAVDDVSLSIYAGTTVGLLGANGSGKSTLLKLIGGILTPDSGTVQVRGRLAALLELGAGFHPDLSGRENVYLNAALLGLSRSQTDARFDEIVDFSGIREFIDNEVKFYSSGMYMRLAFAVAVHTDPDVLLVDEVLAVGDEAFQRKCMDKIRSFQQEGRTIILVSHAASQISELCDTTFVMSDGELVFAGPTADGLAKLRGNLEGRRRTDAAVEVSGDLGKPETISVSHVEALTGAGEQATTFRQGEPMTLRLHLHAAADLEAWTTGFGIDTPNGQMILGTSTDRLKLETGPKRRGDTWYVDFMIDKLHFGVGDYFVNARATDVIDGSSSVRWQSALFHVAGSESSVGIATADIVAAESPVAEPTDDSAA